MKFLAPLFCASLLLAASAALAAPQLLDEVVAIVDKGVVLASDVDELLGDVKRNAAAANQPLPPADQLREQVLEQLITRQLQLQIADRMGMKVSDAQLDQTLHSIADEQQLSFVQLQAKVAAEGREWPQFREQIREEIKLGDVRRINVQRRVHVSQQEVESLAKQLQSQENANLEYHIGHIRIDLAEDASNESVAAGRQRAEQVMTKIREGADFRQLAIAVSSGPKALEGGDWGYLNINEMPTLFAETVEGASSGALFGPLRSGSGFHIIKVFAVRGAKPVEVTEYRVRHILIKPSVIVSEERARQLLQEAATAIRANNNLFGDYAARLSEDTGSAANKGELGWATSETYVPEFKKMTETLAIGELSEPFRTEFGWHIMQVMERRQRDVAESHLKDRAYRLLFNRKFMEQQQLWLQEMRGQAYIQIVKDDPAADIVL